MATINKAFRVTSGLVVSGGVLYPSTGTTTVAPIVFTSGTNLSSATAGAMEYDGTNFYLTPTTGNRKTVAFLDSNITGSAGSVTNSVTFATTGGAASGTTFNGSAAKTIDYSTIGAAPLSHTHGNISNAGAIGSTAGLIVKTTTGGVLTTLAAGTSGQFLQYDGTWATPTGATYSTSAVTTTGGAFLRLTGSDTTTDDVKLASGTNTTVTYTDANTITFSSTDTNFYPTAVTMTAGTTAGPTVNLTMSGASNITGSAIPSATGTASGVVTTAAQTFAGVKTFSSSPVVPTPTNATDAANKAYVDNAVVGIEWKPSVRVATTTNGQISTAFFNGQVVDGVTLATGDRILIKDQNNKDQNGIYIVPAGGTPNRSTDADTGAELAASTAVFVEEGTVNADTGWTLSNNGPITVGATELVFTQFTGLGVVTAGTGLTKSGNTMSVDTTVIPTLASTFFVGDSEFSLDGSVFTSALAGISSVDNSGQLTLGASATDVNIGNLDSGINIEHGNAFNAITIKGGGGAAFVRSFADSTTSQYLNLETGTPLGANQDSGGITIRPGTSTGTGTDGDVYIYNSSGQLTLGTTAAPPAGKTQVTSLRGANSLYLDNTVNNGFIGIGALANGLTGTDIQIGRNAGTATIAIKGATTLYNSVKMSGLSSGVGTRFVKMSDAGVLSYDTTAYTTTSNKLSDFAATTSAELKNVISDETGTGALVFAGSPALTGTPTLNGVEGLVAATGTTTGTTALTLSSLYSSSVYTGGEFTVKISNGTNIEIVKVLAVTDGTNVYLTTYGDVYIASSIASVDFTYTSTNVNMVVTPVAGTSGTTTVKVAGTLL